ncbi:MAG: Clp protease N-terminal domain-containing protein [Sciscionella sp.]
MFERFNDDARNVVVAAQEEARRLQHNYIGTEHVLLGVLKLPGDFGVPRALADLGITADAVEAAIRETVGAGQQPPTGHIPFTPRSKKVLELSLREALQQHSDYIGPEHIMLGILREGGGVAAQILTRHGRSSEEIRAAVLSVASTSAAQGASAQTPATEHALALAGQAAAGAPIGTHHVLEALIRLDSSMAGKALAALDVTTDRALAQIDQLDLADTSDVTPEQAAAAAIRWEADDNGVRIVTTDPETVETLRRLVDQAGGALTGDGPLAGAFIGLHRAIRAAAGGIDSALNPTEQAEEAGPAPTLRDRLRSKLRSS